jgi:DNA mismatch endonuclease (patch repair protein)
VALGGGLRVPYPDPTDAVASRIGRANKRTETKPEVRLRSDLHRRGFRFRKDLAIPTELRKIKPDIVFTRAKVAVFVDGCFWHGCPEHQVIPGANPAYWVPKLRRNAERDHETNVALAEAGWTVIRVWEHEEPEEAAERVEELVRRHRARS